MSGMTDQEILKWLRGYCVPSEGGCMIWNGSCSTSHHGHCALPTVRHPVLNRNMPARRAQMMAMGRDISGFICSTSCRNPLCMAEAHAVLLTRGELQRLVGPKLSANRVRSAKLAKAARRRSSLTIEQVREMRASGLRATDAARVYGVQLQTASRILRGQAWREYEHNPFAGLGAR